MKRNDDFEIRRQHLKNLSEGELEQKFWELAEKIVDPMVDLGKKNTTPSIERSVLLRMGFSSTESKEIVQKVIDRNLIGKGAGHVVYRAAKDNNLTVRDAGLKLIEGELWDTVEKVFGGEK
ncbi:MAG: ornithine aminomutase [Firmicutes bacterium]|nr:ornithine aminomutase [Bacillota bacterium]